MITATDFRDSYIHGRSYHGSSVANLFKDSFDIAVLVPSWDKRSVCITEANDWHASKCVVLLFNTRDQQGLREDHDASILRFAKSHSKDVRVIASDSLNVNETWAQLVKILLETHGQVRRPMRLFIDGSACPRYYLLGLVAATLGSGMTSVVSVMYAEGKYPERSVGGQDAEEIVFTDGQWKAIAIPSLEGRYSPGKKRFYLVSIGFEGWKTMRTVTRSDPDRVSILRSNPGTQSGYTDRALADNEALIRHYCIPDEQIVGAPAGDAIAAWKTLSVSNLERPEEENSYFLCSGTKAHSLALGLRAMCLKAPAVLYNLPEGHRVVPIEPTGKFWHFELQSLTVP